MFRKIDADIYVMVDGDDTYDVSRITDMIEIVSTDNADRLSATG